VNTRELANIVISGTCHAGQVALIQQLNQLSKRDKSIVIKKHERLMSRAGLRYAILDIDETLDMQLWGVPSSSYKHPKWSKFYERSLGVLLLVNTDYEEDLCAVQQMVDFFREKRKPVVFGLTSQKELSQKVVRQVAEQLHLSPDLFVACDPEKKQGVKVLTMMLLLEITKQSHICRRSTPREAMTR